jgi:hypothetical protein
MSPHNACMLLGSQGEVMNRPFVKRQAPGAGWSAHEAFLGVPTMIAVCDGQHAARRLRAVHDFAARSPFLATLGEQGLVQLHADVVKRIGEAKQQGGCDALEQACAILPSEMQASVYAACVDILGAYGNLSEADRGVLDRLRNLLNIDAGLALQIETVLLLKNRF